MTAKTQHEYFRGGNRTSPKLDYIRGSDIAIFQRNGTHWVQAGTGGASLWLAIEPTVSGPWWRLPAGTDYPDAELKLVEDIADGGGHWTIEPAADMPLDRYKALLAAVNPIFIRI